MNQRSENSEPFILFEVAGTTYGVRSRHVQQLEMIEYITPVPNAAPFVEGVVFSRGQVIPAISLRARFGFPKIPYDLRTRLVVVQSAGRNIGLIVDAAREFTTIPRAAIQAPGDSIAELSGSYLEGIASLGERMVLILRLDEVAAQVEVVAMARAGALPVEGASQ